MEEKLTDVVVNFGRRLDLSRLDGVTFATDYVRALRDLESGIGHAPELKPTEGLVLGVAMTSSVLRDGELKSHVVVNANFFFNLLLDDRAGRAIELLAHECAHVEDNAAFDRAFPHMVGHIHDNIRDATRWQILMSCRGEYAACMRSAGLGDDPEKEYEQTFLQHLSDARDQANGLIKAFRLHGGHQQIIKELSDVYGGLLKFASYYLGNMAGYGRSWRDCSAVFEALENHWFRPFFERLEQALAAIVKERDRWQDSSVFEALGDIVEDLIANGGMYFVPSKGHPGQYGISLPLTPETIPY